MASHSRQLTFDDAIIVWRMHWAGFWQHQIAAHFDVNQGRISEILNGHRWLGSEAAARAAA